MEIQSIANLALRSFQFLWSLLIMALVGNMVASASAGDPSIVNYTLFVSVFSMLSLFYLFPATVKEDFAFHPMIMLIVDILNTIFFFCGAVALAADLGVHSCGNSSYTHSNGVTNGSHNTGKRCREAQASCAFLWFGFAAYLGSTIISGLASRGAGANLRSSGIRRV